MTEHPITPPPELVQQWRDEWAQQPEPSGWVQQHIATQAARWGADQELEACCEYLTHCAAWEPEDVKEFCDLRRPKAPSLKQQALEALEQVDGWAVTSVSQLAIHEDLVAGVDTIRRALEALPDD